MNLVEYYNMSENLIHTWTNKRLPISGVQSLQTFRINSPGTGQHDLPEYKAGEGLYWKLFDTVGCIDTESAEVYAWSNKKHFIKIRFSEKFLKNQCCWFPF